MTSWPERIFCDTSFFFACLEPRDANHSIAVRWLEQSSRRSSAFWSTWDVVSETITLTRRKCGFKQTLRFIDEVLPALHILYYEDSVRDETLVLFRRFAKDKKLSFCDCLSYVMLTTRLRDVPTATFDVHFKMMGLPVLSLSD